MSLSLKIEVNGGDDVVRLLDQYPEKATQAARMAINDTLKHGRTLAKREIGNQVNLKSGYLDGSSKYGRRLDTDPASGDVLRGRITGRREATSLYRFDGRQLYAPGKTVSRKKAGVSVKVDRTTKRIPRAFIMNLKGGNHGVAIRLPKGETPNRKWNGKPLYKNNTGNVYLLYGPSVNQVFDDVAEDLQPELTNYFQREFQRQFARLTSG